MQLHKEQGAKLRKRDTGSHPDHQEAPAVVVSAADVKGSM